MRSESDTVPAKVLGQDWVECIDSLRDRLYYANLTTKETRWTFPDDLLNDKELVNHSHHWIEAVDVQLHKKYYYNRITKESKWEQPTSLALQSFNMPLGSGILTSPSHKTKKADMLSALNSLKLARDDGETIDSETASVENMARDTEEQYVENILHSVAISTAELLAKSLPERNLYNYGKLNFATAKSGIFKRKMTVEQMLRWSKKGLNDPLHNMQGEMLDEAIQFSKNIRGFMGDRSSTKSQFEHADKIVKVLLLSSQELRDELFCQICKQLNKNPSRSSSIKGWQLFLICLTSACPNNELMISLIPFFKQFIEGKDPDVAAFAEDTLHKCFISTQLQGVRCERPNTAEIAAIMSANSMQVRVWFLDGMFLTVKCDSWVVVSELELIIAQQVGLKSPKYFGLYEALSSGEERLLRYDDRVLDLVAQWKRFQNKESPSNDETIKFVYKVRYFVDVRSDDDMSSIELMYIQAVHDVLNMVDLCKSEDAFDLAALQMHVQLGDFEPVKAAKALERDLERYIPSRVFDIVNREAVITAVSERYAELVGYSAQDARLEYLKIVREIPSYGSSYFLVNTSGLGTKGSKDVVVAINPRGFFVIDNYTKEYIANYLFDSIITWGHSPTQFILATGTATNKRTVSFKCTSGKEMSEMMTVYASALADS